MRDYGKVFSTFWASETTRSMSEDGRMLALYLLTSPHTTMIGAFRLPDGYVMEDMQWGLERVVEGFRNLSENGFSTRDEASKWVFIHKFMEWNDVENPNQAKSAIKLVESVPETIAWKPELARVVASHSSRFMDKIDPQIWNRLETLRKQFRNQEQEQEQEQERICTLEQVEGAPMEAGKPKQKKPHGPVNGSAVSLDTFLARCKDVGERPIGDYKPVWEFAEKVGIPDDIVVLCWQEFVRKFGGNGARASKRYRDWRKAFRNCVEENWFRLWTLDDQGRAVLTASGRIAEKVSA